MSLETEAFVKGLVELVPAPEPLYREHLSDNDELLPHVFMGDVTRFVVSRARERANAQDLQTILNRLEAGLRGSDDVRDLVFASFLEDLLGEEQAQAMLRPLMGPELAAASDAVWT